MMINKAGALAQTSVLNKNESALARIQRQMSTGRRINTAADDAAGRAVAEELLKMTRGLNQASSNIGDAMSALNIADGAAGGISSMLQRQRELAIQASNDTLNADQRKYLDQEFQALTEEIDRVASGTQFNRQHLLDGSSPLSDGSGQIQAGANQGDQVGLDAVDMTSAGLGAGGSISSSGGARDALSRIEGAMDQLNSQRSTIGARVNRFEHTQNNVDNQEINQTASLSLLEDLDYAQGSMEYSRLQLLNQSSTSATASFNQLSRNSVTGLLA